MRTPIGRVSKLSLLLLAVLAAAVAAGLIIPGSTGITIEVAAWIAIFVLVLLEVGVRSTPVFGNYYGDESNRRGSASLERERPESEGDRRRDPDGDEREITKSPPPFNR